MNKPYLLLIGIGNRDRGDDGIGPLIAGQLAEDAKLRKRGVHVTVHSGEGASLMELWQGARRVVIVDAMRSGDSPGRVRRFDVAKETLKGGTFRYSSHLFSLAEAVELARKLKRLPDSLVIYGVEGRDFTFGAGLTPKVAKALAAVAVKVIGEFAPEKEKKTLPP